MCCPLFPLHCTLFFLRPCTASDVTTGSIDDMTCWIISISVRFSTLTYLWLIVKYHCFNIFSGDRAPSYQHEYLRRKLEAGVKEFWNYFKFYLNDLQSQSEGQWTDVNSRVDNMLGFGSEQHRYNVLWIPMVYHIKDIYIACYWNSYCIQMYSIEFLPYRLGSSSRYRYFQIKFIFPVEYALHRAVSNPWRQKCLLKQNQIHTLFIFLSTTHISAVT